MIDTTPYRYNQQPNYHEFIRESEVGWYVVRFYSTTRFSALMRMRDNTVHPAIISMTEINTLLEMLQKLKEVKE